MLKALLCANANVSMLSKGEGGDRREVIKYREENETTLVLVFYMRFVGNKTSKNFNLLSLTNTIKNTQLTELLCVIYCMFHVPVSVHV